MTAGGTPASGPRRKLRGRIAGAAAALVLLGVGAAFFAVLSAAPSVEALAAYRPPQASRVLDAQGKLLARLAPEERVVIPLAQISPKIVAAFLAVEDQRFFEHHGIDWHRVAGALVRDLRSRSMREGSSTLTMQLARNVFPDRLTRARSLRRKLAEMLVAHRIEARFDKKQILELYLNQIYLGNGYYGVEAAARGYFGKPARDVSLQEAAVLAALPKAPGNYDPRRYPDAALKRRNLVLGQMTKNRAITSQQEAAARRSRLRLRPPEEEGGAPWFVAEVRRQLRERFGPDADAQGLLVRTALDSSLQHSAERELARQIDRLESGSLKRLGYKPCDGSDPAACLQGLFVALDPRTGDVTALVGGRDYELSEFDRVLQGRRQAGSAFKPFVWAAALQQKIPISTMLDTSKAPNDYVPADGQAQDGRPLNLRHALRVSSNRAAVALASRIGIDAAIDMAQALGIATPIPKYPSTALGAADVQPLQLVAAFAPFANGGARIVPRFIVEVRNGAGEVLYQAPVAREPAIGSGVAYLMSSLLRDVVERGTGVAARALVPAGVPLLGKTGTTNAAQDVWFVGATPEVVAGVWLGYDHPRSLGPLATGGHLAAPVVGRVLGSWYRGRPVPAAWAAPAGLEEREIDPDTGGLANPACPVREEEVFLGGTAPTAACSVHQNAPGFFDRLFH